MSSLQVPAEKSFPAALGRFLASRWGPIITGLVVGILAPVLVALGNPGNMGICVACFSRDIAGALGLHRAAAVQYIRPEIIGIVLGSFAAALAFREFRPPHRLRAASPLPARHVGRDRRTRVSGLGAGVRHVLSVDVKAIHQHEIALADGLANIPGVCVYGPADPAARTAVVSFTTTGRQVSEIGLRLDEEHDVLCRVGLHCAPAAHRTIGTFPEGTMRLAGGLTTTLDDVRRTVTAVAEVITT